jgi:hypothetical protein
VVQPAVPVAERTGRRRRAVIVLVIVLLALPVASLHGSRTTAASAFRVFTTTAPPSNDSPVANFSASIDRLVDLLGIAGSGLLALVWARVALSWFSHDVTKKVQAKERARDALIGTLLFVAALTGLIWGLAQWVLTGG